MCLVRIISHSLCPPSHNSSTVIWQHHNAIYCADQRFEQVMMVGKCASCAREDSAKLAVIKSTTAATADLPKKVRKADEQSRKHKRNVRD